ncbi:MAG: hypothetical protein JW814_01875 [Candidatus Krumholzibacteriota bacterium]|nr:hypothetical protein [Candidatus Krumholzibacteriota bacterium]
MNKQIRPVAVSLLIGLLMCSYLIATEIDLLSPSQMGTQAEKVVRGKVERIESFWNENHSKVFTRVTVAIDEIYKGQHQQKVDILQLGGVVDARK